MVGLDVNIEQKGGLGNCLACRVCEVSAVWSQTLLRVGRSHGGELVLLNLPRGQAARGVGLIAPGVWRVDKRRMLTPSEHLKSKLI